MTQTPNEKGYFVQFPYLLIEHPDLTRDDGWLLLSLMKDHRTEEPFYISYREMETTSHVARNLLSSYTSKKTGKLHEGCIDRIARVTGYISYTTGREIGKDGNPKGNSKLCITIYHSKIWQGNRQYCETRISNPVSHRDRLGLYDKPVSYRDRSSEESVSNQDKPVPIENEVVSYRDKPVSYADRPVSYRDNSSPLSPLVEPVDDNPIDNKDSNRNIIDDRENESPSPPSANQPLSFLNSNEKDTPPSSPDPDTKGGVSLQPPPQDVAAKETPPAEQQILQWVKDLQIPLGKREKRDATLAFLVPRIESRDRLGKYYTYAKKHRSGTVWFTNLNSEDLYAAWVQSQESSPAEDPPPSQGMTQDEANDLALWMAGQPGLCYEVTAIEKDRNWEAWYACLIYGPKQEDALYFVSQEHFLNPSPWEAEGIDLARLYAASLQALPKQQKEAAYA